MSPAAAARLKDVCEDAGQYGFNISASEYAASGIRMLRTSDLGKDGHLRDEVEPIFVDSVPDARFLLRTGDLLLTRSGSIGRSFLVPPVDGPTTFAGFLVRFRPRPTIDARFLAYVAASGPFLETVQAESVSSTIQNFNAERYAAVPVPNPPLDEQRRIADFLDTETAKLDALTASRTRQAHLFDEGENSALVERIESAGPHIKVRHLVSRLTSGPRGWGDLIADHGVPFIRITNVPRRGIKLLTRDLLYVDVSPGPERERSRTRTGDVLVTITADIGSVGIVDPGFQDANVNQHIALLRPDLRRVEPEWLAWSLKAPRAHEMLTQRAYGGTKVGLSLRDVAETRVAVPPRETQLAHLASLAERLNATDQIQSAIEQQVRLLTERRQALITAAVTGELDVMTARG